jgi:hypothetical protein
MISPEYEIKKNEPHKQRQKQFVPQEDIKNLTNVQIATRFIYLNRTCFNGLYRVNAIGEFNVPFGQYYKVKIFNETTIKEASGLLNKTIFEIKDFRKIKYSLSTLIKLAPPDRKVSWQLFRLWDHKIRPLETANTSMQQIDRIWKQWVQQQQTVNVQEMVMRQKKEIPAQFYDPIFMNLMVHPIRMSDGITYQFKKIKLWWTQNPTSPHTRKPLEEPKQTNIDRKLEKKISEFRKSVLQKKN